jgi:hypothetical protein
MIQVVTVFVASYRGVAVVRCGSPNFQFFDDWIEVSATSKSLWCQTDAGRFHWYCCWMMTNSKVKTYERVSSQTQLALAICSILAGRALVSASQASWSLK